MGAKNKPSKPTAKVKVLYQYLNDRWYAFADLGDDIFFGQVPVQLQAKDETPKKPKAKRKPSKAA